MFNRIFILIWLITRIQQNSAVLPSYVHVHTPAEIMEINYVVLHQVSLCEDSQYADSQLFIAIKSAVNNLNQRELVRQTWLPEVIRYRIPYVFMLGSTNDEEMFEKLLVENRNYHDLIIGKFVDDYYNLTLKSIFTVTWASVHCSSRWLLYVDDDAIINIRNVIRFFNTKKDVLNLNIFCNKGVRQVHREVQNKWYVPESVWLDEKFPEFCYGSGYLIPSDVLTVLSSTLISNTTTPKLWLEDVFVTGIAAKAANIKIVSTGFVCCQVRSARLFKENMVLGQMGKDKKFLESWKAVQKKSALAKKSEPRHPVIRNGGSVFQRKGLLMSRPIENHARLRNFIQSMNGINSRNRAYLWILEKVVLKSRSV
ncbi:unnamed protein product [Adineta ricciae]|uniref:Hexosyltransferase n=1 Tax=Adineta ricciae TaxID=249248 RepID=A0A814Q4N7_ADIRI|nr:unnamed protein product [Adineta ricciae]